MSKEQHAPAFSFEISLSVLNHLGRNLYRSFTTVLGEAISNSWDADAKDVYVYIDRARNRLLIKDNGIGMDANDFQNKFLKIGYSKRKESNQSSGKRPYIGRKGIGKLALLSCAEKITVISKKEGGAYVGGSIDNAKLDKAITEDLVPSQYPLGAFDDVSFGDMTKDHKHGTILLFENIKEGIKHSNEFLKKIMALYFRFSLVDKEFNIHVEGEKITEKSLDGLARNTEFLWMVNKIDDPYIKHLQGLFAADKNEQKQLLFRENITGFIASVSKPRDLKILETDERVGVDLFVNGRLREKDILKHIPTARVVESYLYGQIHYNDLDDVIDRFTSSREGIVPDDPKFKMLLSLLKEKIISHVLEDWDDWRRKHRKTGDAENTKVPPKERKAEELYNVVAEEYLLPTDGGVEMKKVDSWVGELSEDAAYNFSSYAECFISENLIRKYILDRKIAISEEAQTEIKERIEKENASKKKGNISIEIRKKNNKLGYLSMVFLANLVDKKDPLKEACLPRDSNEYKPMRDALSHTALLTDEAKKKLTTVYVNIKGRIRDLLAQKSEEPKK